MLKMMKIRFGEHVPTCLAPLCCTLIYLQKNSTLILISSRSLSLVAADRNEKLCLLKKTLAP